MSIYTYTPTYMCIYSNIKADLYIHTYVYICACAPIPIYIH